LELELQHEKTETAQMLKEKEIVIKRNERLKQERAAALEEVAKAKADAQAAVDKANAPKPEEPAKEMSFESVKTGPTGRANMMVERKRMAAPKVIMTTHIVHKSRDKEEIIGDGNYNAKRSMWEKRAVEKGGKPQPLPLSQQKAYGLITKLATRRNLLPAKDADDKKEDKGHATDDSDVISNEHTREVAKLLDDIQSNKANIHVEKSRTTTSKNVLKITKCTAHLLKPRLYGYMNIGQSSFIPRWKLSQNPRYFFVLDGLPSETNTNEHEPDFAKNRKHDHLVPTLCFFENKEKYDEFHAQVKEVPTRTIKFQRLFAQYAKGTYPLANFAIGVTIANCTRRIQVLLNNDKLHLPKSEVAKVGVPGELDILCCSDSEIHKFSCNDTVTRDKWVKKINKLVDKRSKRLAEINSGLFGVATGYKPKEHQHDQFDAEIETDVDKAMRPTVVGKGAIPSMSKLVDVEKVEPKFD